jgi:hypothetical protein
VCVWCGGKTPAPRNHKQPNPTRDADGPKPVRWRGLAPTRNGYEPRTGVRASTLYPYYTPLPRPGVGSVAPLIVPGVAQAQTR